MFTLTCDDEVSIIYPENCLTRISTFFENLHTNPPYLHLGFSSKVVDTLLDIVVFPDVDVTQHDDMFWLEILQLANLLKLKKKYQENLLNVVMKIFTLPHNYLYPPPAERRLRDLEVMLREKVSRDVSESQVITSS